MTASTPSQTIAAQLDRILASSEFARSKRMSRFLRYTVEAVLSGQADDIKEYRIGVDVFDRRPDYDPRVDPIVRVEARRLREKLTAYYETAGPTDEVVITFEKGSYVPTFRYPTAPVAALPVPVGPRTVAVLPLADLSRGGGHQYFGDGLTEELIHALTRVSGLQVVAWNSATQFRAEQPDIHAVADQLRVSYMLTGSIRMDTQRLRVRVQLIDTASGAYLWSETYDREVSDVFAIQEEIARAIVRTLRIELTALDNGHSIGRPGGDIDAYDLYLKGRFHWNKRTPEGLRRSVRFFQAAAALDPVSALAQAGLADAYSLMADYSLAAPDEVMPSARAAAQHALQLNPELAEAWTSLALIRSLYDREWKEAGDFYRHAIELNPGYATAHFWYAVDYLAILGRHDEAMESINRALQLDPLSIPIQDCKGLLYIFRRDFDSAIDYYTQLTTHRPEDHRPWSSLGRAWERKNRYDRALECLERARVLGGDLPHVLAAIGQVHAYAGRPDEARAMLVDLETVRPERPVHSSGCALIRMSLGEYDRALDWLEIGCERRELPLCSIGVHPIFDPLRGEPRFQRVIQRVWPDVQPAEPGSGILG